MIDILAELFSKLSKTKSVAIISQIVYLTQGKLYPSWMDKPEIGIAEKMAMNAISVALGINIHQVVEAVNKTGDIGKACEGLLAQNGNRRSSKRLFWFIMFMTPW